MVLNDFLKNRKMFFTHERREILRAVEESGNCFKMEDILDKVTNRGMYLAKSTVYRNLQLLCAAGIIELKHRDGQCLFHRYMTGNPVYRIHCRECDSDQDINDPSLQQFITDWCRERGYDTSGMVMKIDVVKKCRTCNGNCRCKKTSSQASTPERDGYLRLQHVMGI